MASLHNVLLIQDFKDEQGVLLENKVPQHSSYFWAFNALYFGWTGSKIL